MDPAMMCLTSLWCCWQLLLNLLIVGFGGEIGILSRSTNDLVWGAYQESQAQQVAHQEGDDMVGTMKFCPTSAKLLSGGCSGPSLNGPFDSGRGLQYVWETPIQVAFECKQPTWLNMQWYEIFNKSKLQRLWRPSVALILQASQRASALCFRELKKQALNKCAKPRRYLFA